MDIYEHWLTIPTHFHHIFAAHVHQGDSTASSMVQGDIYYPTIVTPSLVSAVCQFIKNIVVLAPQDTFSCLKKDNFIQIFTKYVYLQKMYHKVKL